MAANKDYGMMGTYLVDDMFLLHLSEETGGFRYDCFHKENGNHMEGGEISWEDMNDSSIRSPLACARVLAIAECGLNGEKVSAVSVDMLEKVSKARALYHSLKEAEDGHSIRFSNSHYDDLFKIPDGGMIHVSYPDRSYIQKCEYIDGYHFRVGRNVFHICQFAEIMERNGGTYQPEQEIMAEEAAWKVGSKGYLLLQTCDDGYDYTLLNNEFHELDGGQLDMPDYTMN